MGKLNIGKNLIHKNHITSHVNAGVMGERNKKKKERKQAALTCRLLERNGKDEWNVFRPSLGRGETYEEAICKLAKLIAIHYGEYNNEEYHRK